MVQRLTTASTVLRRVLDNPALQDCQENNGFGDMMDEDVISNISVRLNCPAACTASPSPTGSTGTQARCREADTDRRETVPPQGTLERSLKVQRNAVQENSLNLTKQNGYGGGSSHSTQANGVLHAMATSGQVGHLARWDLRSSCMLCDSQKLALSITCTVTNSAYFLLSIDGFSQRTTLETIMTTEDFLSPNISDQVAGYMRDPSRMINKMYLTNSTVRVFGKDVGEPGTAVENATICTNRRYNADYTTWAYFIAFAITQGHIMEGDPGLIDDFEFYQQLLKEFLESCDRGASDHSATDQVPSSDLSPNKAGGSEGLSGSMLPWYHVHEKITNFMAPEPMFCAYTIFLDSVCSSLDVSGCAHGNKQVKGFMFEKPVDLKVGVNHVVLLSSTMGMKDSGGELAEVKGGIQECLIQGLNTGTLDLQAALEGELKEIYSEKGLGKVQWKPAENDRAATWYKVFSFAVVASVERVWSGCSRVFADKAVPSWREQLTLRAFVVSALLAVMFSVIVMKLNLTTGIIPSLNVSAGLLGFFFVRMWTAAAERMGFLRQPFTRQENTVIQTCVVSAYGITFSGGFGSYLFEMSEKIAKQATTVYHGGTNFGRTGASYVLTGYYDEAPMDEYGMYKEPKFGHLRDLAQRNKVISKSIPLGQHSSEILGHWYEGVNQTQKHQLMLVRYFKPCLYMDAGLASAVTMLRTCTDVAHVLEQFRLAWCGKLVRDARTVVPSRTSASTSSSLGVETELSMHAGGARCDRYYPCLINDNNGDGHDIWSILY
ncbi:putative metal-nicotianamine transporter YSL6 [Zea mays]|uniref:beta-galactosidase n=1 Tax=Zea mays TaxID=4577 RepID=A0A1D6LGV3_MAIZE|nr:putative metal-nicotianamine transporter YSL6 [Zea mays]